MAARPSMRANAESPFARHICTSLEEVNWVIHYCVQHHAVKKKMRILVTAHSIAPSSGGLRIGVLGICRGLIRRGHQVTLITTNAEGKEALDVPLGVATDYEGVKVYFYPIQLSVFGNAFSIPLAEALKLHVQQADVVLIHSLYQFMSTAAAHYCRRNNVPYILRPHGTLDPFLVYRRRWFLKWSYIRLFEERNFHYAAAVQYSCQMEKAMTRQFLTSKINSLAIPEGVDLQDFAMLPLGGTFRAKYPELDAKIVVLFLGRFHQKKGLELLIVAFARVAKRCPNAHLVLAGSGDRDYIGRISQMLKDCGIVHCSTITGQLTDDEKLAALADADIFALPSHGENFGLAVVEAMACGLPVLISDKVGICREVAKCQAGIVTTCDPNKIADGIEKLVNEPELRVALGQNGKKLAEAQFNIDRMAERMEIEYHKLFVSA